MAEDTRRRLGKAARRGLRRAGVVSMATIGRPDRIGRFVIICPPRTGSNLLMSLLDAHPEIRCEGELLADGTHVPVQLLQGRAARAARAGASAWGCKIVTNHFLWHGHKFGRDFLERLDRAGYQFIVLRRRNWLLQAISMTHGIHNDWHYSGGTDRPSEVESLGDESSAFQPSGVEMIPEEVLHQLWMIEREDRHAATVADQYDHLALWYEDDLETAEAQQRAADAVATRLGLTTAPVTAGYVRGLPATLEERVANLDELTALVRHTRWARFLEPDE